MSSPVALTTTSAWGSLRLHGEDPSEHQRQSPQAHQGGSGAGSPEVRPRRASTASQPLSFRSPLSKKQDGGSRLWLSRLTEAFTGGKVAVHTHFVPDVMQPWLGDGNHPKDLPLQPDTPCSGTDSLVALLTLEEKGPAF